MTGEETTINVTWGGPYCWPGFEGANTLPGVPSTPGVYLPTFEYQVGYLPWGVGITRRPIRTRLREHTRKYMNGEYTILDIAAAGQGLRKEIWHGWGYARNHRDEFEERKTAIQTAARELLAGFRVFVTDVGVAPRILERFEASIMSALYSQSPPIRDMQDRGMHLVPRWDSEKIILTCHHCPVVIHGLSGLLEI